ncbi:hypothetical protein [Bacillus thuringiensis]|uniref:hypothetical protein n=1 Tax=Bacillus thuringiensis TaxID=1428 RepID=UPI000BFB93B5|nr:hypothetical protein [Bacillus thuringiensis]PGU98934.1 hypothetical protein COD69_13420 [Bacillus thuringiensis]
MVKIKLKIEETVKYEDEIIIEVPKTVTKEQFDGILDKLEKEYNSDTSKDVAHALKEKYGFTITKQSYSFPDAPSSHELEIVDCNYNLKS